MRGGGTKTQNVGFKSNKLVEIPAAVCISSLTFGVVVAAGGVDWKFGGEPGTLFEKTGGRRGMTG